MLAYKIKEGIYWVGAIDWGLRIFHGYSTGRGSTYNAYLIIDEKITLIDNVKEKFSEEMFARISSVIDPSKIDIIVSNHGEPDHSGAILKLISKAPSAKIYSQTPNGVKILNSIYGELPIIPVKNNDTLSIGKRNLKFIHSPMVHWPDNMLTYVVEDKILFSNDMFGQHLASSVRFDFDYNLDITIYEAKKYYANIVLPYTQQALKVSAFLKNFEIEMIAPSHGLIWAKHIKEILDLYDEMINHVKKEKAVVIYDTMWGSTQIMATAITEAFTSQNIPVSLYNINDTKESDLVTEIFDSKYLAVGSSTLNNQMLPTVASILCYLKGLSPIGIKYMAFGSYGWGGQSIQLVDKELESIGLTRMLNPIRIQYVPKKEQLEQIITDIVNALKSN